MTDRSRFDARIAALIAAYADRAPIEVDPMAMTRLAAAATTRRGWAWADFPRTDRGLGFVLLLVALLVSIVAGVLVAGGVPFRRHLDELLTQRGFVQPFIGLPPEGATPSTPEAGELVLSFGGRPHAIAGKLHRVWVYMDGRLIWIREGNSRTPGVLEQRLSPEGVELMRSEATSAGLREENPERWGKPGLIWGGIQVRDAEQLVDVRWLDPELPGRLADPASWLPASVWEDQRIGAYVPSRHAVCIEPSGLLDGLPDPTLELIRSRASGIGRPARSSEDLRCPYRVTTEDARAIIATLDHAGLQPEPYLRYHIPFGPRRTDGWVEILPILPHGEVVCDCG